jgi:hypothetical protein
MNMERNKVVAAVERYLAGRGIPTGPAARESGAAADAVSSVVDRFLATRKTSSAPRSTEPPAPPKAPEPATPIVDFVCENDVRDAIRSSRKIYIGAKTIVTPSAREVGEQFGILVLAQR